MSSFSAETSSELTRLVCVGSSHTYVCMCFRIRSAESSTTQSCRRAQKEKKGRKEKGRSSNRTLVLGSGSTVCLSSQQNAP